MLFRRGSQFLPLPHLSFVENTCNYNCVVLTSPFSTYFTALGHEEAERGYVCRDMNGYRNHEEKEKTKREKRERSAKNKIRKVEIHESDTFEILKTLPRDVPPPPGPPPIPPTCKDWPVLVGHELQISMQKRKSTESSLRVEHRLCFIAYRYTLFFGSAARLEKMKITKREKENCPESARVGSRIPRQTNEGPRSNPRVAP